MVSNIFCFHPYLGKWWNLTSIFRMGWFNHQLTSNALSGNQVSYNDNCNHVFWITQNTSFSPSAAKTGQVIHDLKRRGLLQTFRPRSGCKWRVDVFLGGSNAWMFPKLCVKCVPRISQKSPSPKNVPEFWTYLYLEVPGMKAYQNPFEN